MAVYRHVMMSARQQRRKKMLQMRRSEQVEVLVFDLQEAFLYKLTSSFGISHCV